MTDCKRPVSQDQSQSSFGSSEFFWETASDTGGDFYKQPARGSAGGSRRKQRRMKEGAEVGEREVAWTSPSISQSHFQTAAKPAGPSSHHHLSDCWGGLRGLLMNLFVSASLAASGGVLKQTCPLTRPLRKLLGAKWEKCCEAYTKNSPTTVFRGMKSNIW